MTLHKFALWFLLKYIRAFIILQNLVVHCNLRTTALVLCQNSEQAVSRHLKWDILELCASVPVVNSYFSPFNYSHLIWITSVARKNGRRFNAWKSLVASERSRASRSRRETQVGQGQITALFQKTSHCPHRYQKEWEVCTCLNHLYMMNSFLSLWI